MTQVLERPASADVAQTGSAWRAAAVALSGLLGASLMAPPWSPIGKYFSLPASQTDYGTHTQLASELLDEGIRFVHFLWHVIVVAVHAVAPWLSWMAAAQIVVVASYGLQAALLAWVLTSLVAQPRDWRHACGVVALALALMTAAPVTILNWGDRALYYGYLNMDSYASPTQALLKPLALLAFVFTVRGFASTGSARDGVRLGVAAGLSTLAKPSLSINLLPATAVVALARWARGRRPRVVYLTCGLFAPVVGLLAWQYSIYFAPDRQSTIEFAPFLVMGYYSHWLAPKLLLSILMPLTVVVAYGRQVLNDVALELGWMQFAFGAAYTYLLAETRDTLAGNFAWSGQIGTYLLFVVSTVFVLRHWQRGVRSASCAGAFLLHVASGVLFFVSPWSVGSVPSQ